MNNNSNWNKRNNYSIGIKRESNNYNQVSLNEENKIWNEQTDQNPYNNKNNNSRDFNKNKFLGFKREKPSDNNCYSSASTKTKYNQDNNNYGNNRYNSCLNDYNSSYKVKKEKEDNYYNNSNNNNYNNRNQSSNFDNYNHNCQNNNNNYNRPNFNSYQNNSNNYYRKNFNSYQNNYDYNQNNDMYQSNGKNVKYVTPTVNNELPIFARKEDIIKAIAYNRVIIISGNTGCGKSTQVPQYIYGSNCANSILMTQPRRIAAVSIAKRLADEMHERLGGKIGYHVSMNPNFGPDTKIFVKTTGIFMEELIHKNLEYTHIIIDEVHERDIYVDLVLALIKWYFENNRESKIKLILMSATIAEDSFADYLRDINGREVPIIKIHETMHTVLHFNLNDIFNNLKRDTCITDELKKEIENVATSFLSQVKNVPVFMDELFPVVAAIIEKIENENPHCNNGVLIFVPGLAEIQELQDYLSRYFLNKNKLEFLILHSQISDDEQDKVFKYGKDKRKIILATNIAESSITISNIDFVIDFCLVKQTRFDEYQNTSVLELKWCSKASCQQRKGRTGRVNKGYYFQLITDKLYRKLEDHPRPEILRSPLETPDIKTKDLRAR